MKASSPKAMELMAIKRLKGVTWLEKMFILEELLYAGLISKRLFKKLVLR